MGDRELPGVLEVLGFRERDSGWENAARTVTVVVTGAGAFLGWNDVGWFHPSRPCRVLRDVVHIPRDDEARNPAYLSHLIAEAQRQHDAALITCRYCQQQVIPGHAHDAQTCQGCAVRWLQITAGDDDTCALLSGGSIDCWGDPFLGGLGNGSTTDSSTPVAVSGITNATQITAGDYHTCALLSGGSIDCWGENDYGELGNGTTINSSAPVGVSGFG